MKFHDIMPVFSNSRVGKSLHHNILHDKYNKIVPLGILTTAPAGDRKANGFFIKHLVDYCGIMISRYYF